MLRFGAGGPIACCLQVVNISVRPLGNSEELPLLEDSPLIASARGAYVRFARFDGFVDIASMHSRGLSRDSDLKPLFANRF